MNAEIERHLQKIIEICEQHGVTRLELFGSATGPAFDKDSSDFDFIATFADTSPGTHYGFRFLDFAETLEAELGRKVDVITQGSIRNPYFRQSVDETRTVIFEAGRQTTPV
jgi:uncharacterized protein